MTRSVAKIQSWLTQTSQICMELRPLENDKALVTFATNAKKALKSFDNASKFLQKMKEELGQIEVEKKTRVQTNATKTRKLGLWLYPDLDEICLLRSKIEDATYDRLLEKIDLIEKTTLSDEGEETVIEEDPTEQTVVLPKDINEVKNECSTAQRGPHTRNLNADFSPIALNELSSQTESDESTVRQGTTLMKSVSTPVLTRSLRSGGKKREFNMTPLRHEEKRLKTSKSTTNLSKAIQSRKLAPKGSRPLRTRIRSPSPSQSSLFRTSTNTPGTSSSLFKVNTPTKQKTRTASVAEAFKTKQKKDADRLLKRDEEIKSERERKKKEKEDRMNKVKQKREEEENKRRADLKKNKDKTRPVMTLKSTRNKAKIVKQTPSTASSCDEPMSVESLHLGTSKSEQLEDKKINLSEFQVTAVTLDATYDVTPKPKITMNKLPTPKTYLQKSPSKAPSLPLPVSNIATDFPPKDFISYEMTPKGCDKSTANKTSEDYGLDDLSSGDETDDDEAPRKNIPKWAEKKSVNSSLQAQYYHHSNFRDMFTTSYAYPERLVDLEELLRNYLKHKPHRLQRINARRETSIWSSPMRNAPTPLDRTLNLDQSCMPFDKPTPL